MNPAKFLLDVNGVDVSAYVAAIPKVVNDLYNPPSTLEVVLDNKAAARSSSFSLHQVVGFAQARCAFHSQSDYFTGADNAAPNAKWTVSVTDANQLVFIWKNKLACYVNAASKYAHCSSTSTISQPFSFTVYMLADNAGAGRYTEITASSAGTNYWQVYGYNGAWYIDTRQSAAWANRATGGTFAANTWYFMTVRMTSATSIAVVIYDVFGNVVWNPGARTFDSVSSVNIMPGIDSSAGGGPFAAYYDSFLVWSASTVQGEQLFEGYIDEVILNHSDQGNFVTLRCKGYEADLTEQFDDPYGKVDQGWVPTYGATNDVDAGVAAFMPSGWTRSVAATGVHDPDYMSLGTPRSVAIDQIVEPTPAIGWYVLPMKHIAVTLGDLGNTVDSQTDAVANWTINAHCSKINNTSLNIEGTNAMQIRDDTPQFFDYAYATYSVGPVSSYAFISFYYGKDSANLVNFVLRIYTDTGTPKYWQYTPPTPPIVAARAGMVHLIIPLPDANGTHGWTAVGSPSLADTIIRVGFYWDTSGGVNSVFFDSVLFYAIKKLTSKYTVSQIIDPKRNYQTPTYPNRVSITASDGNIVVEDTTLESTYGIVEKVIGDLGVTMASAKNWANALIAGEIYSNDPISVMVVNPSDMYLLRLGDTVTITDTYLNLSSATRVLIRREDSFTEQGWRTVLSLSANPIMNRLSDMWGEARRKRHA